MATEPQLAEVLAGAINSRLTDVHTVKVGKIQTYDPETGCADVIPVTRRPFNIGDDQYDTEDLPVIPNVPVVFLRGGGHFLSLPLAPGDHVVLAFTDDSIATWRDTGTISDPDDLRRHCLGSALAFAGLGAGDDDTLSMDPLDLAMRVAGMVLGKDGSPAQLAWSGDFITAGRPNPVANRVSPVALGDRTDARLQALEQQLVEVTVALIALTAAVAATTAGAIAASAAALGTHTHPVIALGSPTGPPVQPPPAPPAPPGAPPAPFVPVPLTTAADVLKGTGPLP